MGRGSMVNMPTGSCLLSNHGSPPSSPPLNIPPPPRPPLSRAPSLGGSIGRASGCALRHNGVIDGTAAGSGCPQCRFATIATPTHRPQMRTTDGTANGSVYSHCGHQQRQGLGNGNHHYGSSNSYSGEWGSGAVINIERNLN